MEAESGYDGGPEIVCGGAERALREAGRTPRLLQEQDLERHGNDGARKFQRPSRGKTAGEEKAQSPSIRTEDASRPMSSSQQPGRTGFGRRSKRFRVHSGRLGFPLDQFPLRSS